MPHRGGRKLMVNARAVASVLLVLVVMLAGCVSEETVEEAFPEFELETA